MFALNISTFLLKRYYFQSQVLLGLNKMIILFDVE